ncbi:MAG: SusF/SusE family outer membrane protein [Muribaculaceae bacterium]|nr:SusF/SusE family outer membrane protein [Muribaculaceae bacterium]
MKKTALLFGIALAMGLSACDDMLPNPEAPTYPEFDLFASDDLAIAQAGASAETPVPTIDLQTLADAGERAVLVDITKLENWPSTYDLVFDFEASLTPDFAKSVNFQATATDGMVAVPAATLNSLVYDNYTHDPSDVIIYTRIAAYAVQGTSSMRLGGADYLYGEYNYNLKLFTPERVLDTEYYLMYREPGAQQWSTLQFAKADAASSVYDNGLYSVAIDVTAAGLEWAVSYGLPGEKPLVSPVPDPADADNAHGTLNADLDPVQPAILDKPMPFLISIDVLAGTYTVSVAYSQLYVPGGATSNNPAASSVLSLFTNDYVNYTGTMRLYSAWSLAAQRSENGIFFIPAEDQTVSEAGVITTDMTMATGRDKTLTATNGLYYVEFNITTMKIKASPVQSIQVIGNFNGWDLATAAEMTSASRFTKWTATGIQLKAGEEFKFCVDRAWTLSYGGELNDVQQNGANFTVDADGTYDITLDFSKQPNKVTMVKK